MGTPFVCGCEDGSVGDQNLGVAPAVDRAAGATRARQQLNRPTPDHAHNCSRLSPLFCFQRRPPEDLGVPADAPVGTLALDINNSGRVLGVALIGDFTTDLMLWRDGN